jgi:hypothetical protein
MIYWSYYVIQSLLLCCLCIHISYGRIGYCLVVYTVPCLGDHLSNEIQCGNCTDPTKAISLWWQGKILDIAIDEVSGAMSMHVVPRGIRIVVVPAGVTVLLGLHNPPRSWTDTVGPSLPDFTIAPCVNSLLCYRSIKRPKSILQDSPEV